MWKLSALVAMLCLATTVHGHLQMTFPPARKFALDFLDNVRTPAPCSGMTFTDGMPITTLETGKTVRATWHVAYPHMGGIRFELLNATSGEVTASLTGDGYQYTNDSTRLYHDLTFGADHVCDHCILRITRQAGEWTAGADGYLFWSCADVKIMAPGIDCYDGKCLNGGTCSDGTCQCVKTYTGDRCEYKNDCDDDTDCNSNGVCYDIQSTYYPTKVCYCNAGKMGRYCSKDSPVTNAVKTAEELTGYYKSELYGNPEFSMYWKLLGTNKDEIEVVLQVKTKTWVALGWRPNTVTGTCRSFPVTSGTPTGTPEGSPEGTAEPETTPEPASEPETTPEPTTAAAARKRRSLRRVKRETEVNMIKQLCLAGNVSEAIAWANSNYNSDPGAPVPEPEGTPEGTPAPEGEGEPAPGTTAAPEGAPEGTPEGNPEGTPEGAPEGQPEGNSAALHAMDCQDMVFLSAEGNRHRILDSYTRDRSTPRPDSFFGGTDDLTAAAASHVDGMLHAAFRRKLYSSDQADHTIPDGPATFIWARGQDPNRFYHWPIGGLERCQASNYDYYKINELKYHGTKDSQRGSRTINVYDDPNSTEEASEGSHSSPKDCTENCNYVARWRYRKSTGMVQFTITAKVALQQWAAIGFSDDQNMVNTDAVVVWMDNASNPPTVTDRYITARTPAGVALDGGTPTTSVVGGSYNNGQMTVEFTRPLKSTDDNDLGLDTCRFFLYAWGGNVNGNDLTYHSSRETSTQKICIDSGSARIAISNILSWSWIVCVLIISRLSLQ
ncbi:uncharacterized protein LOC120343320 [Styela clava]